MVVGDLNANHDTMLSPSHPATATGRQGGAGGAVMTVLSHPATGDAPQPPDSGTSTLIPAAPCWTLPAPALGEEPVAVPCRGRGWGRGYAGLAVAAPCQHGAQAPCASLPAVPRSSIHACHSAGAAFGACCKTQELPIQRRQSMDKLTPEHPSLYSHHRGPWPSKVDCL